METKRITAAIDLGAGYTKWCVKTHTGSAAGLFPSSVQVAPAAFPVGPFSSLMAVHAGGRVYSVGFDSADAADSRPSQMKAKPTFWLSEAVYPLFIGALASTCQSKVDTLVVVFPEWLADSERTLIGKQLSGTHMVPVLYEGSTQVREVRIGKLRLPLAHDATALGVCRELPHASRAGKDSLVLDFGYSDTTVIRRRGVRASVVQCYSLGIGMSHIFREVRARIGKSEQELSDRELEVRVSSWSGFRAIDELQARQRRCCVRPLLNELEEFLPTGFSDKGLSHVVLTGGGAHLVARYIKQSVPEVPVLESPNPRLTTVNGALP